jgi:hypothetical protein
MIYIIVFLTLIGAIDDIAFSGERLEPNNLPLLVRIRWAIIGAAVFSISIDYDWPANEIWPWVVFGLFLITMAKRKKHRASAH